MSSNSFPKRAGRSRFLSAALALLAALVLLAALLPRMETRAEAAYYDEAVQKLIGWDVIQGYPDGTLQADSEITRAEFLAMVNRAYGYTETAETPFTDVPATAWYSTDVAAAYAAGYFNGTSETTASPTGDLTREQAMVMLARNMRLEENPGEVTNFSDGRAFQSYSAGYANTAVAKGVISGYTDGTFRPGNNITRGDMAIMLSRALGNLVNGEGTYALGDVFGNVTINSANVTLRDTTIAGDLYLTGGLGLGGVTLENVRVLGDIIVAGGGESDAGESVILRNVSADNIIVDTLRGEYVSLRAEGDTNITRARLMSDAYIQDRTAAGLGFKTIQLEGAGGQYSLSGNLENVVNAAPNSALRVSQGIVQNLTMDEAGVGASLWLDSNATVLNLSLDSAVAVRGQGDIRKLNVNVAGTTVEQLPDEIEVRPGLTGNIAGTTMDSTAAAEASAEPHLQAGYPNITNVAATTATANFSTNKAGTIYWAVTAVADGSVNEEALLTPAAKSTIVRSGNLAAAQSNTVYSVNLTGLTSGGSYYLTAMLVDARGDYSPIKVASFTTTDNTTPAFGSGFPYMSLIEDTYAYATVMATKNCQLYWVVFDKGSSAPTPAAFRSGAFQNAYGYGVVELERNITDTITPVNNLNDLTELESYDIYFWLNDPDSAKSSAVRKLTFTTVDRTPPEFNVEPTVTTIAATSLRLTTNLNEAGTVYWVIVDGGEDYPKQPTTSILERYPEADQRMAFEDYFKLQISNGMNGLRAGSVRVRANTDATFTITGLQPETQYRIYYIAKDNAGNYSVIKLKAWTIEEGETLPRGYDLDSNYIWQSTLDEKSPTVDQAFIPVPEVPLRPDADADIEIVFSERVQYYTANNQIPLDDAYTAYQETMDSKTATANEKLKAQTEFLNMLRDIIQLFSANGTQVKERTDATASGDDWVIDYRNAVVTTERRDGRLKTVITFPTVLDEDTKKPTAQSALNLNSDASYYFTVNKIADTSDKANLLEEGRVYTLDTFTTVGARVYLEQKNLTQIGNHIPVDLVYSMTPKSVSRADPTKSWDMFIWADHGVKFNLYTMKKLETEGLPTADDTWTLIPDSKGTIDRYTGYTDTFKGLSYWRDLNGYDTNPYIRGGDSNPDGLEDGYVYYYAIQLTEVDGKAADVWTGDVEFWVTVDSGMSGDFTTLCTNLSETRYNEAVDPQTEKNRLTELSGKNFTMTASFRDTGAPDFAPGYPALDPKDTSVSVNLLLEREGAVYWVVAPADGTIPTKRLRASEAYGDGSLIEKHDAGTPVSFGDYDVPVSGDGFENGSVVFFFDDGSSTPVNGDNSQPTKADWYPHELANPTSPQITLPEFGSKTQFGYIDANSREETLLPITNLNANREYFLYLVTMGKGGVPSANVQLYKFKTLEAYRPPINLTSSGSLAVDLRLSYDDDATNKEDSALTDFSLFQFEILETTNNVPMLSAPFYSSTVMDDKYDKFKEEIADRDGKDINGKLISEYTVYEAIQYGPNLIESYFDLYASTEYKEQIYRLIKNGPGGGSSQQIWQGGPQNPLTVDPKSGLYIDCTQWFTVNKEVKYYILTASRYENAVPPLNGNSYTFRAYSPIEDIDYDPPKIERIDGHIDVYYYEDLDNYPASAGATSTTPVLDGFVYITFDKDLEYYNRNERHPIHQYFENSETSTGAIDHMTVKNLSRSGNGILEIQTSGDPDDPDDTSGMNQATRDIILKVKQADTQGSIDFSNVASASSDPIAFNFKLNLNASDSGTGPRTPTYNLSDPSVWKNGENFGVTTYVYSSAPTVEDISLNMVEAPTLAEFGQQKEMTVTVWFSSPSTSHTVVWTSSDESVASVLPRQTRYPSNDATPNGGGVYTHTAKVTAIKSGSVTITATCGGVTSEPITITVNIEPASFQQDQYQVKVGGTLNLGKELELPEGMEIDSILWRSDRSDVASVSVSQMGSDAGLVRGVSEGKATITATVTPVEGDQVTLSVPVTVTKP